MFQQVTMISLTPEQFLDISASFAEVYSGTRSEVILGSDQDSLRIVFCTEEVYAQINQTKDYSDGSEGWEEVTDEDAK